MPRRRLTDDEQDLWRRVARTARRMLGHAGLPEPPPKPVAPPPTAQRAATLPPTVPRAALTATPPKPAPSRIRVDLVPPIGAQLAQQPVKMDRKAHTRMMRGKIEPESRIDLHGMTVAQAHQALSGFIINAHRRDLRLVLVITGKGRTPGADHAAPMPVRAGVLKHEVPHWLRSAPLAPLVLELREAHLSHGGTGAYYVYLRRRR